MKVAVNTLSGIRREEARQEQVKSQDPINVPLTLVHMKQVESNAQLKYMSCLVARDQKKAKQMTQLFFWL